ncbi:MAG: hypothetical protein ACFFAT_21565 [Promethearchaeota archaeon]
MPSLSLLGHMKDIDLESCSFDLQKRNKDIFTILFKPNTLVYVFDNKDCLNQGKYPTPEFINSELSEKKILEKYIALDHLIASYWTLKIYSNKMRYSFPLVRNDFKLKRIYC